MTSSKVYSNTRTPRSWSSLRRWASGLARPGWRALSGRRPRRPRRTRRRGSRLGRRGVRRIGTPPACAASADPDSRTSSRNRRSRWVWPPESVIISSTRRHPHRPEPRSPARRRASTSGDDSCRRTALSIAASMRWGWARASARSNTVRVADMTRNPSTTTWSIGSSRLVVCTAKGSTAGRRGRSMVNSTACGLRPVESVERRRRLEAHPAPLAEAQQPASQPPTMGVGRTADGVDTRREAEHPAVGDEAPLGPVA